VTVARPISDSEGQDIALRLGQALDKKVDIQVQVDPSILGGIVLRLGDRLIDASVKGRLDRLRAQLAS
jgi:F-type H+-transporting ATPase subunit delta